MQNGFRACVRGPPVCVVEEQSGKVLITLGPSTTKRTHMEVEYSLLVEENKAVQQMGNTVEVLLL